MEPGGIEPPSTPMRFGFSECRTLLGPGSPEGVSRRSWGVERTSSAIGLFPMTLIPLNEGPLTRAYLELPYNPEPPLHSLEGNLDDFTLSGSGYPSPRPSLPIRETLKEPSS